MKVIPYILYLSLLAFFYSILSGLTIICGASIDLAVILVMLIAIYKSELTALWFAVFAGIIAGTIRLDLMPWEILILAVAALVINQVSRRMNLESIISRMIILGGFALIHGVAINLIIYSDDIIFTFYRISLTSAVYTMVIGWLIIMCLDGRITLAKFKALF